MSIFRKSALDALSTPEKLDQPLKMVRPSQWVLLLSLGGFCISILLWSILGRLPIRISGRGLLVRQNSLKNIQSEISGRLELVNVKPGDCIEKGQLLASIKPVKKDIEKEKLLIELNQLMADDATQDKLEASRIFHLKESIKRLKYITKIGGFPVDELDRRQQQLRDLEDTIFMRSSQRNQRIIQHKAQMDLLAKSIKRMHLITSPADGCIVDSIAVREEFVQAGTSIFTLESINLNTPLESLAFFPAKDGKRISIGQKVRITPSTTKQQRHGGIEGVVKSVVSLPVSDESLSKRLGRNSLLHSVRKDNLGPIIEVHTSLSLDSRTNSGYDWGGGAGPKIKLTSGTPTSVRVLVEQRRPISYIIPILRDLTGIY